MTYQKELLKIKVLLIIGLILAVGLSIYTVVKEGTFNPFEIEAFTLLIAIVLYPIGIIYGWRQMLGFIGFVNPNTSAERYYTKEERMAYQEGNWIAFAIRIGLALCFCWIIGSWNAWRTLRYLKKIS